MLHARSLNHFNSWYLIGVVGCPHGHNLVYAMLDFCSAIYYICNIHIYIYETFRKIEFFVVFFSLLSWTFLGITLFVLDIWIAKNLSMKICAFPLL